MITSECKCKRLYEDFMLLVEHASTVSLLTRGDVLDKVEYLFDEIVYSIIKLLEIENDDRNFIKVVDLIFKNAEFEELLIELGRE